MPAEAVEQWLGSGIPACIRHKYLHPVEHTLLRGSPLFIQRGQAGALIVRATDGGGWIIKKFHQGKTIERNYLQQVTSILPRHEGFRSGTQRTILARGDLKQENGSHHSASLDQWLDGTILMPRNDGIDWAALADRTRDGDVSLDRCTRLTLARGLAVLIDQLEGTQASHRDLSSSNVFICVRTCQVSLIDFDSLYHPTLQMPKATTCGTVGYTAAFAWRNGNLEPGTSWRPYADRVALALLIVEFLILEKDAPLTAEGGMFQQDELCDRSGPGIQSALSRLKASFPRAASMFEATLQSDTYAACPSPKDWIAACDAMGGRAVQPPSLAEVEALPTDYFEKQLARRKPGAQLWPAPSLADLPMPAVQLP